MDSNKIICGEKPEDAPGLAQAVFRRVYLVRHGVTEWNKLFRYQGASDIPLSPDGEEQAERAGLRLSQFSIDRIISSPLKRSLMTAHKIAEITGVRSVEIWEELREVNFGDWEGLTVKEIISKFGEDVFNAWRKAQIDVTATNGEASANVYKRAGQAVGRINALEDEITVVVSHGALFRALMLHFIDVPKSNVFWRMRMDNCSISAVEFDRRGQRSVRFFNDTAHLSAERDRIQFIPLQ